MWVYSREREKTGISARWGLKPWRRLSEGEGGEGVTVVGVLWGYCGLWRDGTQVICGKREKSGRYAAAVMTGLGW